MTQISRYPLRKDVEQRTFEIFKEIIASLNDKSDIEDFLSEFFSPVEKIMLSKRLAIAMLLEKGYDYESIRSILKVTPSTIARVSTQYKYAGRGYKHVIQKIIGKEQFKTFLDSAGDILTSIPPGGADWSRWRKNREVEKRDREKAF